MSKSRLQAKVSRARIQKVHYIQYIKLMEMLRKWAVSLILLPINTKATKTSVCIETNINSFSPFSNFALVLAFINQQIWFQKVTQDLTRKWSTSADLSKKIRVLTISKIFAC